MMDVKPRLRLGSGLWLGLFVAAMLAPDHARAQIVSDFYPSSIPGFAELETIPARPRPDYDPQGVRVGDFTAHPYVAAGAGYDSNYLATTKPNGSPVLSTSGGIDAASDWSRNKLAGTAYVLNSAYLNAPQQTRTDALAGVGGDYEIGRDTLTLAGLYVFNHILATDLDAANISAPVGYNVGYGRAAYRIRFAVASLEPEISYATIRFDNLTTQGQTNSFKFLDRDIAAAGLTGRYALSDITNLIATVRGFNTNYVSAQQGIANQSSNSYQVLGGLEKIGEAIWQYRVLAGLETRQFNNAAYKAVTTPIAAATVLWSPTRLTSVTGTLRRAIEDSVESNQIGYYYTGLSARIDHELLPNVLLQGNVGGRLANYLQSSQQDTLITAGTGVTWLMNRNMTLTGVYGFTTRGSNVVNHYDRNVVLVQLKFGL